MNNLKKFYLVAGCICLSLTLFSFKSTESSQKSLGDATVYYQNNSNSTGGFEVSARTAKLAKKLYQNDCRLVAYAVIDWATSVFDNASLTNSNTNEEMNYKLNQL